MMKRLTRKNVDIVLEPCCLAGEMANITIWIDDEKKIPMGINEVGMTLNDIVFLLGALHPFNNDYELEADCYPKNSDYTVFYGKRDGTFTFSKSDNPYESTDVLFLYHNIQLEWMYSFSSVICNIKRPIDLEINPDITIKLIIEDDNETHKYECSMPYLDLCYCVAKAFDSAFRKNGVRGFQQMMGRGNVEMSYYLYLKALALDKLELIEEMDIDGNTRFENEMALLMMYMN